MLKRISGYTISLFLNQLLIIFFLCTRVVFATGYNTYIPDNKQIHELKIIGDSIICPFYPYIYKVENMLNSQTIWHITGGRIYGDSTSPTVTVIWENKPAAKIVCTQKIAISTDTQIFSDTLKINQLLLRGEISGKSEVCEDEVDSFSFSLRGNAEIEMYKWSVHPKESGCISSGQGTSSCTVNWYHNGYKTRSYVRCQVFKCGFPFNFGKSVIINYSTIVNSITSKCTDSTNSGRTFLFTANIEGAKSSEFIWEIAGKTFKTLENQITYNFTNYTNKPLTRTIQVRAICSLNQLVSKETTTTVIISPMRIDSAAFVDSAKVPVLCEIKPGFIWYLQCNDSNNGYNLILCDNSESLNLSPITKWKWKIDGKNCESCDSQVCIIPVLPATTHIIELIAGDNNDLSASITEKITVPPLPEADFSIISTLPQNRPDIVVSCEATELKFINHSKPSDEYTFYEWNFDENTYSLMKNPIKEYYFYSAFMNHYPLLEITDKYGCVSKKHQPVQIYENNFDNNIIPNMQYTPYITEITPGEEIKILIKPNFYGGNNPLSFQWFSSSGEMKGYVSSALSGNNLKTGIYWVKLTDSKGCKHSLITLPAIIIVHNK